MGIFDKTQDFVSKAISVASSKREFLVKQAFNAVLLFIIFLVTGCLDFATLSFHLEYLAQLGYWTATGTKVLAGVCSFNLGINFMWEIELHKDKILNDSISKYEKLLTYKQLDFEYFVMKIFNPREKKKAYISQINHKIYKLNKYSKAKDRLLYSSELPESQALKLENRYCIKRQELEDLKKDDFIEKNLESIKVDYTMVDPAAFEVEIDGSASYRGVKTKGNAMKGRVKASSSVVIGMLGVSMLTTAIALEINTQEMAENAKSFWNYFIKCVSDIGVIVWQLVQGMNKTRKIVSDEYTLPYAGRIRVLTEYLEWRLENEKPDSKAHLELNKDEEYIELTEEELAKLKQ